MAAGQGCTAESWRVFEREGCRARRDRAGPSHGAAEVPRQGHAVTQIPSNPDIKTEIPTIGIELWPREYTLSTPIPTAFRDALRLGWGGHL